MSSTSLLGALAVGLCACHHGFAFAPATGGAAFVAAPSMGVGRGQHCGSLGGGLSGGHVCGGRSSSAPSGEGEVSRSRGGGQGLRRRRRTGVLDATIEGDMNVNKGKSPGNEIVLVGGGGPGTGLSNSISFEKVMDSLGPGEKYNAVLQGLAGLVLSTKGPGAPAKRQELLQLLREMKLNNIKVAPSAGMAVIDAVTSSAEIGLVHEAVILLRSVGFGLKYSRDLPRLAVLPLQANKRVNALKGLPLPPADERGPEIATAGAFLGAVSLDAASEGLANWLHLDSTIPTLFGAALLGWTALDLVQGSGALSKKVLVGLNRLFLKDVERESRAEAGGFLAAYVMGLPCFAFTPNVLEAVKMVEQEDELGTQLNTPDGVHRVLVWLLSSVAGEAIAHRQLIASDPRQATAFLAVCRERNLCGGELDAAEDEDRIRWAFKEARGILRDNQQAFDGLRQRLETGGATVGECCSLLERTSF